MASPIPLSTCNESSAGDLCKVIIHTFRKRQPTTCTEETVNAFLREGYQLDALDDGFRWIHLPVNNMIWAEKCAVKLGSEVLEHWSMDVRPAISSTIKIPLHARRMEPKFDFAKNRSGDLESATLYMPYLNWDQISNHRFLAKAYGSIEPGRAMSPPTSQRHRAEVALLEFYEPRFRSSLHPRRTLDQFYYSLLASTAERDCDQTISKHTGSRVGLDGNESVLDDSFLIMVDQLWCWVLDEKTILSCFPSHNLQYHGGEHHDLFGSITSCIEAPDILTLFAAITEQAVTHLWSQRNLASIDPLETYRWATAKKTAGQVICLRDFHREYTEQNPAFDVDREMQLVLEVADVIDELKLLKSLFETQQGIVDGYDWRTRNAKGHLKSLLATTNVIEIEAKETYRALIELLDLKAKTASLAEARATTKQGSAVMLFTIVTIIFLPLSFFTAYFGQNVSEITGDDSNPSSWDLWRVGAPVSIVIITTALLVAFHIMAPQSRLWFWKRGRARRSSDDTEMGTR